MPKTDRHGRVIDPDWWEDGHPPCGQPGTLEAIEMDEPWESYTPVYWCPEHA
jgi:hypothetical protein